MELDSNVSLLPRVGSNYEKRLKRLGITTVFDLLNHYPSRYLDLSKIYPINKIVTGEYLTIQGNIWQVKNTRTKTGKMLTLATINDGTASIEAVWFNQPYLAKNLKTNNLVNFSGKAEAFGGKLSLINPEYEIFSDQTNTETIHTGRIVPIYPETYGISSKWLRRLISRLLEQGSDKLLDSLPNNIIELYNLFNYKESIRNIHFPQNLDLAEKAKKRLAFEELLLMQISSLKRKEAWQNLPATNQLKIQESKIAALLKTLPFELTNAQKVCFKEILGDLEKGQPMNRLLQGDVGSGKTVVAAIAMYATFLNNKKSILMAPTEILAFQHHRTITTILGNFLIKVGLLTSSKKENVEADILIGTHALIHRKINFDQIGLIVIDEQHRFGVEQRAFLRSKSNFPNFLTMTATPIPRTTVLTLYGDLDLSIINELPLGRKTIKTYVVPPVKREDAYGFMRKKLTAGEQIFIVCPLIEPSETLETVKSAQEEFATLKEKFKEFKLGLLHGKLKSQEKEELLKRFRARDIQILVTTPVVELGIDVPNATVMAIEASERFGLASLHQLRGRVGRGEIQSYCLLFSESRNPTVVERLKFMEKHQIGLELAEIDLKLRGPGEVYGTSQSGIPNLKIASFSDFELIKETREASKIIINQDQSLNSYPRLLERLKSDEKRVTPD